ncbi:MAG: NfeD family protein [Bacillota bacterium]|jgi:membrane protein implicated in regulation of membrane protease activity
MHWAGWVIVAVVCAVLEMATPSFFIGWFGVGALAGALMSLLRVGMTGQIVAFLVVSVGLVISTKRISSSWHRKESGAKTNVDAVIGKSATVIKEIPAKGMGQVKVNGEVWTAAAQDESRIPAGVTVEVVEVEGVHLVVKSPE